MSGFAAMRREVFEKIKLRPIGLKIILEILLKVKKLNYRIAEVPIVFNPRVAGKEKGGIKEGLKLLRYLTELRFKLR